MEGLSQSAAATAGETAHRQGVAFILHDRVDRRVGVGGGDADFRFREG